MNENHNWIFSKGISPIKYSNWPCYENCINFQVSNWHKTVPYSVQFFFSVLNILHNLLVNYLSWWWLIIERFLQCKNWFLSGDCESVSYSSIQVDPQGKKIIRKEMSGLIVCDIINIASLSPFWPKINQSRSFLCS